MIILKYKDFSNTTIINKVVEKLDREGIEDYEVSDRIPNDVISITAENLNGVRIYIPEEMEYSQFEIDDYIRKQAKFVRTNTTQERKFFIMKLTGTLTQPQYYNIIKWIIEEQGFCTILGI